MKCVKTYSSGAKDNVIAKQITEEYTIAMAIYGTEAFGKRMVKSVLPFV